MKKLLFLALFAVSSVFAKDIEISNIFAKATPPTAKNSAIFMKITNNSNKDIVLLGGSNNLSKFTEIHTHKHEDGMMKMIQIPELKIPANSSVELKPGGLHIMLIGLKEAGVKEGQKLNLTLNFNNGEKIELDNIIAKKIPAMKK